MWKSCVFNFAFVVFCWLAVWNHIEASKSFFVQLFFSSCGTDNMKRNCLIEENLARTFITNIFWTRGLLARCYPLFLSRKLSMTQLLWKQLEQKLNFLLDIPKHIGKRTPKKTIWPLFFVKLSRIAIAMYMLVSDSNWNSYRFRLLDQFIFVDRDTKYFVQSVPADWVSWIC